MAEDSISFAPHLLGQPGRPRKAVVHHAGNGMFAIRDREWKLVVGRGSGGFTNPAKIDPPPGEPVGELYHVLSDPHEDQNLYAEQPVVVDRLRSLLETWRNQGRSRSSGGIVNDKIRTMVEQVFSRLKVEFGANSIRPR